MSHIIHRTAAVVSALVSAFSAQAAEFATVVSSTPVTVTVPVPRQVCSDGQQWVQARPSGAGAVIGALAGGAIGSTLGGGFGRAVATGVGAVTGAVIGDQVEANANPATVVPVRRCQTVSNIETRVVGYDVVYDYAGQRYSTRMARDPGQQLAVSVQPVESSGATVPAPVERAQGGTPVPLNSESTAAPTPVSTTVIVVDAPQSIYYAPPPAVYLAPMIGFGLGYYGGYRGGYGGYGGYRGGYGWHR